MSVHMKPRFYAVSSDRQRRYAILEGGCGCTVLRMLPDEECAMYYRDRRNEICLDLTLRHWLRLCRTEDLEGARRFLGRIGVNTSMEEAPLQDGEAHFPIFDWESNGFAQS